MNAQELIEITQHVRDPDEGLRLLSQDNRDAGQQMHREANRRIHNFVAASKTLIDHTREFMRENYAGTLVFTSYHARVAADFDKAPVAKLVQDFRNYMLHKGLPPTSMFLHFEQDPDNVGKGGKLTSGIRYEVSKLLEWDGWTAPAKKYIEAAGDHLDVHVFAEEYLERVIKFHRWLAAELNQFHADDLAKLRSLQAEFGRLTEADESGVAKLNEPTTSPAQPIGHSDAAAFEFSPSAAAAIDGAGASIVASVRKVDSAPSPATSFTTARPVTPITPIETPMMWGKDEQGRSVLIFVQSNEGIFGLDEESYARLQPLGDKVLETTWAKRTLSRKFIEEVTLRWCRSSFLAVDTASLSEALAKSSRDEVKVLEVWSPIAHLEVEATFEFGPARIAPITAEMISGLEAQGRVSAPQQQDDITALFKRLRTEMQGLAAVVVRIEAESKRAEEEGETVARSVIGLLRFFSPAANKAWALCPVALLGSEVIPCYKVIILGEGSFSSSERVIPRNVAFWQISQKSLGELRQTGLIEVGRLVHTGGLSDFALTVRSSLLLYGTGTTFPDFTNRLVHSLLALEGLLLRHAAESTEFNIGERMSLLLTKDKIARKDVWQNVREVYRLRRRHGATTMTRSDESSFATFVLNAHRVLRIALTNINSFNSKSEFLDAVDQLKDG